MLAKILIQFVLFIWISFFVIACDGNTGVSCKEYNGDTLYVDHTNLVFADKYGNSSKVYLEFISQSKVDFIFPSEVARYKLTYEINVEDTLTKETYKDAKTEFGSKDGEQCFFIVDQYLEVRYLKKYLFVLKSVFDGDSYLDILNDTLKVYSEESPYNYKISDRYDTLIVDEYSNDLASETELPDTLIKIFKMTFNDSVWFKMPIIANE